MKPSDIETILVRCRVHLVALAEHHKANAYHQSALLVRSLITDVDAMVTELDDVVVFNKETKT